MPEKTDWLVDLVFEYLVFGENIAKVMWRGRPCESARLGLTAAAREAKRVCSIGSHCGRA